MSHIDLICRGGLAVLTNVGEWVDRFIRKSALGRNLSRVRVRAPRLYRTLRALYSHVFRMSSSNDLARYQIRAVRRFFHFVDPELRGKGVLEVGSDLDSRVIRELSEQGCSRVVGINPAFSPAELDRINATLPAGCELQQADMRNTGLPDNSIGALFSVSVFEHLLDFKQCLLEMHRILVPGGIVYAEFGPIWSSSLGHHVHANANGEQARHWDPGLNPLDGFSHLLQGRQEMGLVLRERVSEPLGDAILEWVYEDEGINRLFFEDYLQFVKQSPFELVHFDTDREHVPEQLLSRLGAQYPRYRVFDVRNVELVLRKRY
jgi:SAM-dependent methyltransferase